MIRALVFPLNQQPKQIYSPEEIKKAAADSSQLIWISLENAKPEEIQEILRDIYHLHPLVVEDCLSVGYQPPKVDEFSDYLLILVHAVLPDGNFNILETMELDLILGQNYLITIFKEKENPPIHEIMNSLQHDERLYKNGADFLCHAVLDRLVDDYMPVLDHMDEEIEWLEDQVLSKPTPNTLERILNLKHSTMALRRIIGPQREVMNRLSRDEFVLIDEQSRIYFRDIYDHLVRIQDLTESIRDLESGAMDIYLSSTSLRLNEVMKALTIVSTIFLPLTFVAGVYGMNFLYMPELKWHLGYPFVWLIFLLIVIGMMIFFKIRKWF
ncbi:MAG: magnesium/cobalt transporter CorA [Anaerolineaceae bacterium]